jgi:hypothetical protein
LGVKKIYTTAYHPQGDGAAERRFRTLTNSINACHQANLPWIDILDSVAYAYNNSYNRMIDAIPFQVFLGRLPTGLSSLERDDGTGSSEIQDARAFGYMAYTKLLQEAQSAHNAASKAQAEMARYHNAHSTQLTFRLHDLVWLFTPKVSPSDDPDLPTSDTSSRKLQNYWSSQPLVITKLHEPNNATVKDSRGSEQRVHFNRLRPYISPLPEALTTTIDGRPVIIHHIISSRLHGTSTSYKVRWFPFNLKADSTVPASAVAIHLILDFENRMADPDNSDTPCDICTSRANAEDMLLCDGCDKGFHNPCLNRTPGDIPDGSWFCPTCAPFVATNLEPAYPPRPASQSKVGGSVVVAQ